VQVDRRIEEQWIEQVLTDSDEVPALDDFGLRCKLSDLYRGAACIQGAGENADAA
jgi:hypothetical protein